MLDPRETSGMKYRLLDDLSYFSSRYNKWVVCEVGMLSDGATFAKDLPGSMSFWIHDRLCREHKFYDGTPCNAWKSSMILKDILDSEGRPIRQYTWKWATFIFCAIRDWKK